MSTTQISAEHLASILGGLFGCESDAKQIESTQQIDDPKIVSTYNDMEGNLQFLIVCDLQLANSLGAALTMIPPSGAEDAIAEGEVPSNIADNLHEVLNICSAVFAEAEHHRIVLDQVKLPGHELPNCIQEKLLTAECLLRIEYELNRYPGGQMSLLRIS